MHNILVIDVDNECSPELQEAGIQAKTEAAAIRKDREELDRDRAAFGAKPAEDFVFGEADAFRDRLTALLVRELRLRQGLQKIDMDHRRELARLLDSRAMPDLRAARASIGKQLVQIGFPPEAEPGETDRDKILVGKLIDRHKRVAAAAGRVDQLRQTANSRDFALRNDAEILSLRSRIKTHQASAARV